jgi:hypothetical protein
MNELMKAIEESQKRLRINSSLVAVIINFSAFDEKNITYEFLMYYKYLELEVIYSMGFKSSKLSKASQHFLGPMVKKSFIKAFADSTKVQEAIVTRKSGELKSKLLQNLNELALNNEIALIDGAISLDVNSSFKNKIKLDLNVLNSTHPEVCNFLKHFNNYKHITDDRLSDYLSENYDQLVKNDK